MQVRKTPRLHVRQAALQPLIRFGGWIMLSTILSFLATQFDQFLVANVLGGKQLAGYQIAGLLASIPMISLSTPISAVIFPTLCRIQDDAAAFKRTVAMSLTSMMVLGAAMLIAAPFAIPLVFRSVLSEKWMFATSAAVALFAAQICRPPLSVLESSWLALGFARRGLWIQLIRAATVIACIPWYQSASSLLDIAHVTLMAGLIAIAVCMIMAFRTGIVARTEFGGRWLATHVLSMTLCISLTLTLASEAHSIANQSLCMILAPLAYLTLTWGMAHVTKDQITLQIIRGIRLPFRTR